IYYMLLHNLFYEYQNQLFEGNNGNVSGNGFSFLGNGFSNVATWILNSGSNVSNSVGTTICNIANTFNGWFGGGNVCSGNNNSGNGGSGSAYSPVPYIAYNLMDNIDNNVWPRNVFTGFSAIPPHNATYQVQGTNTIPSKVAVYQNLSSNAHIYATSSPAALNNNISSNVAYRAGKEITLTDGFQVDAGSSFHAYVSRYLCNGNNGEALNLRQNANSGLMVDLNHYETDTVNQIPIHYVEYPKSDSDIYPVVNESSYQTNPVSKDELQNNLVSAYSEASEVGDKPALSLLETEASKQRFVILPNPNNGVFKIFANKVAATEEFTIVIYDMKGLEVTRYDNLKDNVSLDVDFTQLSRGIYMINISSTLGYKNSKKVSIN
ncbi:MAG: T9SS type A sorting domain-containing protein, partial [Bacteroidia bacterium]